MWLVQSQLSSSCAKAAATPKNPPYTLLYFIMLVFRFFLFFPHQNVFFSVRQCQHQRFYINPNATASSSNLSTYDYKTNGHNKHILVSQRHGYIVFKALFKFSIAINTQFKHCKNFPISSKYLRKLRTTLKRHLHLSAIQ